MIAPVERHSELLQPTVFVVDDDVSVRESLERLIEIEGWKPQTFESARAFLDHPRTAAPHCLVLDVTLPDLSGLELQRRIVAGGPYMPIIFITGYGDVPTSVRAMKAGAFEFLTKPFGSDVLANVIQQALERSAAALRDEARLRSHQAAYASLTRREREVMASVAAGMLNKNIARELGISLITVKAHRGSVMRKMGVESLADLVKVDARLRSSTAQSDGDSGKFAV